MKLTKLELELMDALWDGGQLSVREVQGKLPEKKRPAYTTVQTVIYRLEEKGAVSRVKKIGNAHIFEAIIKRRAVQRRLINDLLDLFGGSVEPSMAHFVELGKLTLEDVRGLEQSLEKLETEGDDKTASEKTADSKPPKKRGEKR